MPGSTYGEDGSSAETLYYILTWLGIVVTVAGLIAWVVYENRQLVGHVARIAGDRQDPTIRPRRSPASRREGEPVIDNGSSKHQIEFPPKQTHVKGFEVAMLAISILCVIIVLVIVLFTNIGNEFRPTL